MTNDEFTSTDGLYDIYELSPGSGFLHRQIRGCFAPDDWERLQVAIETAMNLQNGFVFESQITTAKGQQTMDSFDGRF